MSDPRVPHLLDADADAGSAPPLLRSALRGARADVPTPANVDALSKSIAAAIGALPPPPGDGGSTGGEGGPGPGAGAAGAGGIGATKLALGGVAAAAAIGVAVMATRPSTPPPVPPTAAVSATTSATATATATASVTASASDEPAFDVHALPSAKSAPSVAASAAPALATGSPEAEMTLLRSAQQALAGSPAEALAKCDEHAKSYPGGALSEEREVLAVDALLRLGRRSEAESRAARFTKAHPGSAYVRRLDTLLGR